MSEPTLVEEGEASPKRVCLPGDIKSSDFAPQVNSPFDQHVEMTLILMFFLYNSRMNL